MATLQMTATLSAPSLTSTLRRAKTRRMPPRLCKLPPRSLSRLKTSHLRRSESILAPVAGLLLWLRRVHCVCSLSVRCSVCDGLLLYQSIPQAMPYPNRTTLRDPVASALRDQMANVLSWTSTTRILSPPPALVSTGCRPLCLFRQRVSLCSVHEASNSCHAIATPRQRKKMQHFIANNPYGPASKAKDASLHRKWRSLRVSQVHCPDYAIYVGSKSVDTKKADVRPLPQRSSTWPRAMPSA